MQDKVEIEVVQKHNRQTRAMAPRRTTKVSAAWADAIEKVSKGKIKRVVSVDEEQPKRGRRRAKK